MCEYCVSFNQKYLKVHILEKNSVFAIKPCLVNTYEFDKSFV
jgi:hypothetical protein